MPLGLYYAGIDEAQLSNLHMVATPKISFSIKAGSEGDVVDGL